MRENKLVVNGLITIGLTLIISALVLVVVTSVFNKDLFELPHRFGSLFFWYNVVGIIKALVSQLMLGFGIIGGAQIIFLLIKRLF